MPFHSHKARGLCCLGCGARAGQLVPFCEWCGSKHCAAGGRLILSGAICQTCGFQSDIPFSHCPQCRAERHVLCPACAATVALRQNCPRCGLHFLFFDKLRREHSRAHGPGGAAGVAHPAKLRFIAAMLVVLLVLSMLRDTHAATALAALAAMGGLLALASYQRRRPARSFAANWLTVLESYDCAEPMAARNCLRRYAIEAFILASPGPNGSPPNRRAVMVRQEKHALAVARLCEHGFEPCPLEPPAAAKPPRQPLRLIYSASHSSANDSRSEQARRD